MKVFIDFYKSNYSKEVIEFDLDIIPKIGEKIYLEDFEFLRDTLFTVHSIEHTFEKGIHTINLILI